MTDCKKVISSHRTALTRHISIRASDIRYLSSGQIIFLLTMHDLESIRSAAGLTSSLVSYFINAGLNKDPGLSACMESIAEKVRHSHLPNLYKHLVGHYRLCVVV
jgi:phosphatidylinositol 4-kinase